MSIIVIQPPHWWSSTFSTTTKIIFNLFKPFCNNLQSFNHNWDHLNSRCNHLQIFNHHIDYVLPFQPPLWSFSPFPSPHRPSSMFSTTLFLDINSYGIKPWGQKTVWEDLTYWTCPWFYTAWSLSSSCRILLRCYPSSAGQPVSSSTYPHHTQTTDHECNDMLDRYKGRQSITAQASTEKLGVLYQFLLHIRRAISLKFLKPKIFSTYMYMFR